MVDFTDIYYLSGTVILEGAVIRTNSDIKSPIIKDNLALNENITVYGEFEKWLKVRSVDGILGFIEKKYIQLNHTKDIYKTVLLDKEEIEVLDTKINLTWDYTYGRVKNTDNINYIPGINVISPTWFSISDTNGHIADKGNKEYVNKYNNMGYNIWALVDNNFDPELTHEILSSSKLRERVISDLLKLYIEYNFQGINIDFENVYLKDRDLVSQFIRELYPVFREQNIIVSMDITMISTSENWSLFYDREKLQKTVDFMILMAYDQHWASSPVAGSVAEFSWVEKGLRDILNIIPSEKLVLAIPFYTRLWLINEDKISSQTISMDAANKFIEKNNIVTSWDEVAGQYYGEMVKDNTQYKIWIEDSESLHQKISLVHKYNLAGIASWRKGFETAEIWSNIDKSLN